MYDFIFFFIYSQQVLKGKSEAFARFNGSLINGVALGIHILLILSILKKIFFQVNKEFTNVTGNTIIFAIIPLLIFTQIYYNKTRVEKIQHKNSGNLISMSSINVVKIVMLIFVPLILVLWLSAK